MKNKYFYIMVCFVISACCKDSSSSFNFPNEDIGIKITIQDNTSKTVKINSVEWLGLNYIQQVNYDTVSGLTLDIKSNQTKFKINHELGTDTIVFTYNWNPVKYYNSCWGTNDRFIRDYSSLYSKSSRGNISVYSNCYTIKL